METTFYEIENNNIYGRRIHSRGYIRFGLRTQLCHRDFPIQMMRPHRRPATHNAHPMRKMNIIIFPFLSHSLGMHVRPEKLLFVMNSIHSFSIFFSFFSFVSYFDLVLFLHLVTFWSSVISPLISITFENGRQHTHTHNGCRMEYICR